VRVKTAGNFTEVRYVAHSSGAPIQKLDKDNYVLLSTGEVLEFSHTTTRADCLSSIAQSMKRLRDLINANTAEPTNCLWLTLTYRENMRDSKKLYADVKKFNMRFRGFLARQGLSRYEYIACAEPQRRGALHVHAILLFPEKAPFIPNETVARIWGHGFTKTKALTNVDNVGLYLTAYLTDLEYSKDVQYLNNGHSSKLIDTEDEQGRRVKKSIIKGGRLHMYPPGFKLYRTSRGVRLPAVEVCTENEAMARLCGANLTYEKTIRIADTAGNTVNIINYRQFQYKPKINDSEEISDV
jgi:hypothetical protein